MNWFVKIKSKENLLIDTNIFKVDTLNRAIPIFFIDGYIIPRQKYFSQFKSYNQNNLLPVLFQKYGLEFIHYIKGIFIIILFYNNKLYIFNDRHSIKKYFIYQKDGHFFISNSLKLISNNYNLTISKENAAIFTLLSHFIDGYTLFQNVITCQPAQIIEYKNGILNISKYWTPINLIRTKQINKKPNSLYANYWNDIIKNYIEYLKPKGISLTLTGGNDSRMILASLLQQNRNFHSFTFGNPLSYDGVISNKLIKSEKLFHHYYYVEKQTKEWFKNQAKELINFGQGLINIHRAHRNDAIKKEKEQVKDTAMVFTGLVGGEYFKEPFYDNITIPFIFKSLIKNKDKTNCIHIISEALKSKGFITEQVNIEQVYIKLENFLKYGNGLNPKKQKFIYTYLFYGCAHHSQDSNVFTKHIKYVINPFMDIDFIEMMSSSPKWYVNKKWNVLNRLFHSKFFVSITHYLLPELSCIPYAKRGNYTANDLLNHKFKYLLKRISYFIRGSNNSYPENFPLGEWLYQYCSEELEKISPEIKNLFISSFLKNHLEQAKNKKTEKSWHNVTNPINLNLVYEKYKSN